MADNVAVTAGAGTTLATQDRSGVHFQQVIDTGAESIAVGVASVTTTSASAISTRANRKRVVLLALPANTANIDVGPSGVASGSGFPLAPGASVTLYTTAAIHADAASGTQSLAYCEEYD